MQDFLQPGEGQLWLGDLQFQLHEEQQQQQQFQQQQQAQYQQKGQQQQAKLGGRLPQALYKLLDPNASVDLPPTHLVNRNSLDNRELDKLVAALGRSKVTWRRALMLHEWLQELGHVSDDRLCTTLIRYTYLRQDSEAAVTS